VKKKKKKKKEKLVLGIPPHSMLLILIITALMIGVYHFPAADAGTGRTGVSPDPAGPEKGLKQAGGEWEVQKKGEHKNLHVTVEWEPVERPYTIKRRLTSSEKEEMERKFFKFGVKPEGLDEEKGEERE
jgi:hypothetical protein